MFIRLSTYLYGCRFCSDALDSATQPSATDLPSWSLQHWRRGFKLHRYFTRCMMSYVYIYIYIYTYLCFLPLSPIHPLFFCIYGVHAKFRHRLSASGLWQTSRPVRLGGRFGLGQRRLQPGSSHPQVRCDAQFGSLGRSLGFCWWIWWAKLWDIWIYVSLFVQAYPYLRIFLGCEYVWVISGGTGSKLSQSHPRLNYLCISILEVTIWICIVNSYTIVYLIMLSH